MLHQKEAYDIDHVKALNNRGTNETNFLQPMCKACHLVHLMSMNKDNILNK